MRILHQRALENQLLESGLVEVEEAPTETSKHPPKNKKKLSGAQDRKKWKIAAILRSAGEGAETSGTVNKPVLPTKTTQMEQ